MQYWGSYLVDDARWVEQTPTVFSLQKHFNEHTYPVCTYVRCCLTCSFHVNAFIHHRPQCCEDRRRRWSWSRDVMRQCQIFLCKSFIQVEFGRRAWFLPHSQAPAERWTGWCIIRIFGTAYLEQEDFNYTPMEWGALPMRQSFTSYFDPILALSRRFTLDRLTALRSHFSMTVTDNKFLRKKSLKSVVSNNIFFSSISAPEALWI